MKTFYILDISGSMYPEMIVNGKQIIEKMMKDNLEVLDEDAMVFEWSPLWGHFKWLLDDLEAACPEATIWYVGDRYGLWHEDGNRVNSVRVPYPA